MHMCVHVYVCIYCFMSCSICRTTKTLVNNGNSRCFCVILHFRGSKFSPVSIILALDWIQILYFILRMYKSIDNDWIFERR